MRYAAFLLIFWILVSVLLMPQCAFAQGSAMTAAILQDKMERGLDISLKGSTISDDLILRNMNLTMDENRRFIINSSLQFIDCEIKGNLSFGSALFTKPAIFRGTRFSGTVNLARSKFSDYCCFQNAEFGSSANFDGSNFTNSSNFANARFDSTANMKKAVFCGQADFREAKFLEDAYFQEAKSQDTIYFEEAEFYKSALFSKCRFNGIADYQKAIFFDISEFTDAISNGDISFAKSQFSGDANFNNMSFGNRATFFGSKFQDIARFNNAIFAKNAIFTGCKFDGPAEFSSTDFQGICKFDGTEFIKVVKFNNANFSGNTSFFGAYFDRDARFNGAVFTSTLNLSEATFSQLSLAWDSIKDNLVRDKKVNQSMIDNYKSLGWIKDRNQCYYDYRSERRISSEWGFSRIMDTASFIYWGYGVKPFNAIICILGIIILFGVIYKWLASRSNSSISFKDALVLSARTLLFKSPGNIKIEGAQAGYAMWIQKAIFGFFVALFIVFLNQEIQSYFKPPT